MEKMSERSRHQLESVRERGSQEILNKKKKKIKLKKRPSGAASSADVTVKPATEEQPGETVQPETPDPGVGETVQPSSEVPEKV